MNTNFWLQCNIYTFNFHDFIIHAFQPPRNTKSRGKSRGATTLQLHTAILHRVISQSDLSIRNNWRKTRPRSGQCITPPVMKDQRFHSLRPTCLLSPIRISNIPYILSPFASFCLESGEIEMRQARG